MASEWKTATIRDLAKKVAMGPFGSSIKVETFVSHGIPVISGQHLHGFKLEESEFNFVLYWLPPPSTTKKLGSLLPIAISHSEA